MIKMKEAIIDSAFILGDGQIFGVNELIKQTESLNRLKEQVEKKKALDGSNQEDAQDTTKGISVNDIVHPPFDTTGLTQLLDSDETHYRCCAVKSSDFVAREWKFIKNEEKNQKESIDEKKYLAEKEEAKDFIDNCNDIDGFEGTLFKVSLDVESIGWGCIEVVRSMDKKIRRLNHLPAHKVRVLKGWTGYVERHDNGKYTYYQPFGQKVLSQNKKNPVTGNPANFDPKKDGDFRVGKWNLKSKKDLNKKVTSLKDAANELIFIPKYHPKTRYYGVSDVIAALGSLMGNVNIRDFFLQFFEHNAVPQYAIVVKGASLSTEIKELIMRYFSSEIKGQSHKTLIIPIPASAGRDVEVNFEKLSAEVKEGSFQDTRKNNQEAIMIAHGVSPAIIGKTDAASLGSGKGTAQSENYKDRVVDPNQRKWANLITDKLFYVGLGLSTVALEFASMSTSDKETLQRIYCAYLKQGAMTINEVREKAKLGPPLPGGDRAFLISNGIVYFIDDMNKSQAEENMSEDKLKKIAEKVDLLTGQTD